MKQGYTNYVVQLTKRKAGSEWLTRVPVNCDQPHGGNAPVVVKVSIVAAVCLCTLTLPT